jgi:hypothetical protein
MTTVLGGNDVHDSCALAGLARGFLYLLGLKEEEVCSYMVTSRAAERWEGGATEQATAKNRRLSATEDTERHWSVDISVATN